MQMHMLKELEQLWIVGISAYIGYSLVAANTVEEANQYIDSFREKDSNNKCDSWGYSNVSDDDVLEHIFSDEPGIIDYGIRYFA